MSLIETFLKTGLLQFGLFYVNSAPVPFRLNLGMLPSYPDLLLHIAILASDHLKGQSIDHYISTPDSLPLGIALSLRTRVPLVYSRGSTLPPVHDLVGAYDIGHPAVLLCNVLDHRTDVLSQLLAGARRVGLDVHTVFTIIDLRNREAQFDLPVYSLLQLSAAVEYLSQHGALPPGQTRAVFEWLNHHHPGSTAP